MAENWLEKVGDSALVPLWAVDPPEKSQRVVKPGDRERKDASRADLGGPSLSPEGPFSGDGFGQSAAKAARTFATIPASTMSSAVRIAFAIADDVDEPWAIMLTPRVPSNMAEPR